MSRSHDLLSSCFASTIIAAFMVRVSPHARVPVELWSRVFNLVHQDSNPVFILSLATVCKSWTAPAISTLYRNKMLLSVEQSVLLAHALDSHGCKRGSLIRNMIFALTELPSSVAAATRWMASSHRILLQASNLQRFETKDPVAATGSQLASIAAVAHSTLRHLRLVVRDGQSLTILPHIHPFSGLNRLELNFYPEDPLPQTSLDSISPVTMHCVSMLRLVFSNQQDLGELADWMFRCRFPQVMTMKINLPRFQQANGAVLISFFRAHSATCRNLHIINSIYSGPMQAFNEELYAVLRNAARRLSFWGFVPNPFLFTHWAPGAKMAKLALMIPLSAYAAASLPALMDEIGRHDFRPAGLNLVAGLPDDGRLTWGCGTRSKAHGECIGNLMHYALLLAPKGVSIEDQDGRVIIPGAT